MNNLKIWDITGSSQGLGLTLVKKVLENCYRVAATSRNAQALKKAVGVIDTGSFLPLAVDLNNVDSIDDSIQQTLAAFGHIDVVVNNAGYGMAGAVAENTEQESTDNFYVHLKADIQLIKNSLS